MNTTTCLYHILLVEDNPGDAFLLSESLNTSSVPLCLHTVEDGMEAMAYLHREEPYQAEPRPDLIILDLNLPRKDGREVLAEVKGDKELRTIPVVILTSSEAREDIEGAYDAHANCYITKPTTFDDLNALVGSVEEFWFKIVRLLKK